MFKNCFCFFCFFWDIFSGFMCFSFGSSHRLALPSAMKTLTTNPLSNFPFLRKRLQLPTASHIESYFSCLVAWMFPGVYFFGKYMFFHGLLGQSVFFHVVSCVFSRHPKGASATAPRAAHPAGAAAAAARGHLGNPGRWLESEGVWCFLG